MDGLIAILIGVIVVMLFFAVSVIIDERQYHKGKPSHLGGDRWKQYFNERRHWHNM